MGQSIFVTGTDTGVGKTYITSGLIRMLREFGVDAVGFKPVECGGRGDSEKLRTASGEGHGLDEINPVWFSQPLSPMAAADSPEDFRFDDIREAHRKLMDAHQLVLVEGAGGWQVPFTPDYRVADLASELSEEVIIVAANRLGVLNHLFLTYEAVRQRGLDCARVVLNHLPVTGGDSTGYSPLLYPVESFSAAETNDLSLASNADTIQRCLPDISLLVLRDESSFPGLVRDFLAD